MKLKVATKKGHKGRSFTAEVLAYIEADCMFENGGETSDHRPVWIAFASSEQETKAFITNVKKGEKLEDASKSDWNRRGITRFQLLKTAGYHMTQRRSGGGIVSTFYLPEVFTLDPGMVDPSYIKFIMLPTQEWLDSQDLSPEDAEAMLFLAYLDRRTRFPFPPDPKFARMLLDRCLELGVAKKSESYSYTRREYGFEFTEKDTDKLGMRGGIACYTTHRVFESVVSALILNWYGSR